MFLSPIALLCSRKFCFSTGAQILKKIFSESFFFHWTLPPGISRFSIECMVHISEIQHLSEFLETFPGHFCTICRCFQFSNVLVEWKAPVVLQRQQRQTTIGFMSKTTALWITLFGTFLWRPLHDYDVKPPNATFYGGRGHTKTNFPFSIWTWIKTIGI